MTRCNKRLIILTFNFLFFSFDGMVYGGDARSDHQIYLRDMTPNLIGQINEDGS